MSLKQILYITLSVPNGPRQATSHVANVNKLLNFPQTLRQYLSHFQRYETTQRLFFCSQSLSNLADYVSADGHGH
jgi:hypothetical protein